MVPSWTGRYLGNTTGSEQNRQSLGWRALLFRSTEQERMVSIMLSGLAVSALVGTNELRLPD